MTDIVDIREVPSRLAELIARTAAGHEIMLMDGKSPLAKLVPLNSSDDRDDRVSKSSRIAGLHAGAVQMASDFDAPLPDNFWTGES